MMLQKINRAENILTTFLKLSAWFQDVIVYL